MDLIKGAAQLAELFGEETDPIPGVQPSPGAAPIFSWLGIEPPQPGPADAE
jgi:hypothetical protein